MEETKNERVTEKLIKFSDMLWRFTMELIKLRGRVKSARKDIEKQEKTKELPEEVKMRMARAHLMIFAEHLKLSILVLEKIVVSIKDYLQEVQREIVEEKVQIQR